jgi:uncharacterized protein YcaQ
VVGRPVLPRAAVRGWSGAVGKLDAIADRKAGVLRVNAVHEDERFTTEMASAVDAEVVDLGRWLALDVGRA